MDKKTPIYKLNDRVWDALKRFLSSNNPLSWITNIFINILWLIGKYLIKLVKLVLGKKEYNPVIEKKQVEEIKDNKELSFDDIYDLLNTDNKALFIDLILNEGNTSGASDYGKEKIKELNNTYDVVLLAYKIDKKEWYLNLNNLVLKFNDSKELEKLFELIKLDLVFINNLAFYPEPEDIIDLLIKYKNKYKINYAFHDYLSICPSYFLLDETGFPCEVNKNGVCKKCLNNNPYKVVNRNDVDRWRDKYKELFDVVDEFMFFSEYTKNIVLNIYPNISNRCIVKEHKCLLSENHSLYQRPVRKQGYLNVGFVGHFGKTKGADLYIELIDRLKKEYKVKSVIIGYADDEYKLDYKITGRYNRDDLGYLLTENKIDLVIMPSYSNETFSYTVQELMVLNVPIVVFECGAPASRIKKEKYELAEIAEEVSVKALYEATKRLIKKL